MNVSKTLFKEKLIYHPSFLFLIFSGNSRKIDLNRNFPDIWESNDVEREPETKAVMAWLETVPFALAANFHGGTLVANYPFDNNKG